MDDDAFDDDNLATELADIRYERLGAGKYVVAGELRINGKLQTRRIECQNPAYGWAKLEEEVEDILIAQVSAEAAAIERTKRAVGRFKKRKDRDG
jgi:hypothetical protein